MSTLAVVAALPQEIRPLLRRTQIAGYARNGHWRFFQGTLRQSPVILTWTGEGEGRAAEGTERLLRQFSVTRLLGIGVAGALTPGMAPGDLVVAREIRDRRGLAPSPDPRWLREALVLAPEAGGTLVTVAGPVTDPAEKLRLRRELPAVGPAAVDMESAALARVAGERGIPYLVVRAVSDGFQEALPPFLGLCLREDGSLSRARVVAHALGRPWTVRDLARLAWRVRRCAHRLADFVQKLLVRMEQGQISW